MPARVRYDRERGMIYESRGADTCDRGPGRKAPYFLTIRETLLLARAREQ